MPTIGARRDKSIPFVCRRAIRCQTIVAPPSTVTVAPVIYRLVATSRIALAMSLPFPTRRTGNR